MATRLYLPASTATVQISPAADSAWEDTSILGRANASTAKLNNAMATVSFADSDSTNKDIVFRQHITLPLVASQTITGAQSLKFQARCSETSGQNNMFLTLGIRVIASDGSTVQKTVLTVTRDNTEATTTLTNRQFTATSAAGNYTTVAGDRLVIETGMGGDPENFFGHDSSVRYGDAAASDLPEDNTTTTDSNLWVEFTDTLTFVDNLTFNSTTTLAMPAGWNAVDAECWGPGGNGGDDGMGTNGGGGGGGAYAKGNVSVTPGTDYTSTAPAGGSASDSWFSTSTTVMAKAGGTSTSDVGASGGSAASSIGTTKFSGGTGGNAFAAGGGGGGGGSATSTVNGNNGADGDMTNGGAGGTGEATGGNGGDVLVAGANGAAPGAGGGGAGDSSGVGANGIGGNGRVKLTSVAADEVLFSSARSTVMFAVP